MFKLSFQQTRIKDLQRTVNELQSNFDTMTKARDAFKYTSRAFEKALDKIDKLLEGRADKVSLEIQAIIRTVQKEKKEILNREYYTKVKIK